MEQPMVRQFENLSLSSPSFYPAMEEPIEKQFDRILSLPLEPTETEKLQKIRISLYSRFPDCLEEVTADVVRDAMGMHLRVCGPSVLPNRVMHITTRLTTKGIYTTRDSVKQLYGRAVDVLSSTEVVEQIISRCDACFVEMEFEVVDLGDQIP